MDREQIKQIKQVAAQTGEALIEMNNPIFKFC